MYCVQTQMDKGTTYYSTTNVAFVFNKGIIAAADSRGCRAATPDKPGEIITNEAKKINRFGQFLSGIAGCAKYCFECQKLLKNRSEDYEANGEQMSIKTAAEEVGNLFHGHTRNKAAECLISGFEDKVGKIYHVKYDGEISSYTKTAGIGTGKEFALQIIEEDYKKDMTVTKGIALARRALTWAIINDWNSGGEIDVFYLDENGNVHEETFEGEMSFDLKKAEEARIALKERFEKGEFDIDELVRYVRYGA
ncbi:hypothetical protein K1719_020173 [Acacia pycnantha]|nr:hypothetical protein K1719_020173 [Acacia pycnantha]